MKKSADDWFDEYGVCHQNHLNKNIHWICVPAIMLSILGLLWSIPVPEVITNVAPWFNWSIATVTGCVLFYLRLSPALAVGMLAVAAGFLLSIFGYEQSGFGPVWLASLIVFVLAWIGQFIGHKIEGKKPAFFDDLVYLLIGPVWLLGFIYRRVGIPY